MKEKLKPRVLTALVGLSLLIFIVGWGRPWQFSLLLFLVTGGALYEYFFLVFPDRLSERILGIAFGLLVSSALLLPGLPEPGMWLGTVLIVAFLIYPFFGGSLEERYAHLGWTVLGIFYIGYLVPHFVLLFQLPFGREWVFFVFLVIMTGDTAAYFVGSSLGRKKLYPEISPAKTVEGALGSVAASLLAGAIGGQWLLPGVPGREALFLSLVLSVLGQVGDLFESWIKRVFSAKDSGALLPGHGGLLDRLDSLIFPVVFTAYYLRLVHP